MVILWVLSPGRPGSGAPGRALSRAPARLGGVTGTGLTSSRRIPVLSGGLAAERQLRAARPVPVGRGAAVDGGHGAEHGAVSAAELRWTWRSGPGIGAPGPSPGPLTSSTEPWVPVRHPVPGHRHRLRQDRVLPGLIDIAAIAQWTRSKVAPAVGEDRARWGAMRGRRPPTASCAGTRIRPRGCAWRRSRSHLGLDSYRAGCDDGWLRARLLLLSSNWRRGGAEARMASATAFGSSTCT
jgi:hypothetical protein